MPYVKRLVRIEKPHLPCNAAIDIRRIVGEARCIVDTRNMTRVYEDETMFRL